MAETSATFTKAVLHVDANFLQHDAKYSSAEPAADDGENHGTKRRSPSQGGAPKSGSFMAPEDIWVPAPML